MEKAEEAKLFNKQTNKQTNQKTNKPTEQQKKLRQPKE
jgi:hypothetical protein